VKAQAKPTRRTTNNVIKTFLDIGTKRALSSCCEKKSIVNFKYCFSVRWTGYSLGTRTSIGLLFPVFFFDVSCFCHDYDFFPVLLPVGCFGSSGLAKSFNLV
jgi:hypothetical protein